MAVPLVDLCALEVGEGLIRFQRVVNDQHIGPPPGEDAPDGGGQAKPLTGRHKFFDRVFLAREAGPRKQGVKPGTRHHGPAIAHMFVGEFLRIAHTEELPLRRGFLYLVAVLDWYSRYVLAWALSNNTGGAVLPGGRGPGAGERPAPDLQHRPRRAIYRRSLHGATEVVGVKCPSIWG